MYTLYYSPHACSLATHTVLNLLDQELELVHVNVVENFEHINPSKMVPVLKDGDKVLTEGAAIILYLLEKHSNGLNTNDGELRQQAIENIMMANATVHPAYGRLFFASGNISDEKEKLAFMQKSANAINDLWQVIENKIGEGPYLDGANVSAADILLAVYSRWGQYFPVEIEIGSKAQRMIDLVLESNAFQQALNRETEDQKSYE